MARIIFTFITTCTISLLFIDNLYAGLASFTTEATGHVSLMNVHAAGPLPAPLSVGTALSCDAGGIERVTDAMESGDLTYDVNGDFAVDIEDRNTLLLDCGICPGDANTDGTFDSDDLIDVFASGLYESDLPATWETGDWDGDGSFTSDDLIFALSSGCIVPEPSSFLMLGIAAALVGSRRFLRPKLRSS